MQSRKSAMQEAEASYTKATKAELEGHLDRAFKLYIEAAQGSLHISRTTADEVERKKYNAEAQKALTRAQKIKDRKPDLVPVTKDHFSEHEQLVVLQRSSSVNGITYPPWSSALPKTYDASQPSLSQDQKARSAAWGSVQWPVVGTQPLFPEDISQHVISDCSFCASIVVCVAHNQRFGTKLALSCLYPQDVDRNPTRGSDGKHSVRLLFNGSYRRIDLDDQLPTHPDGWMLCMVTRTHEIWPALLEKAYMKLMGGYEFPGSLSTTDLYTLTGWVPEHIDMNSANFEREKTWTRLHDAFAKGYCMLTLGTGETVRHDLGSSISLLPAHCYAVLDVIDDGTERHIVVRDPWQHFSSDDGQTVTFNNSFHCPAGDADREDGPSPPGSDRAEDAGLTTLAWDEACLAFDGIYVSWDPAIFTNQLSFHGAWSKGPSSRENFPRHLQLGVTVDTGPNLDKDKELWVLLTRHIADSERTGELIALSVQDEESVVDATGTSLKGAYTNDTQVLVRVPARSSTFTIVASYDGIYKDVGFSVTVYSSCTMSWVQNPTKLPYSETMSGALSKKNAGGNATLPTFMINPQYHLRINPAATSTKATGRDRKCRLELSIQGDRYIPFNVVAVWSDGQRISEISANDAAISSGAYSYGYASTSKEITPGNYTLVVSAFDTKHLGEYSLKINCSSRFELKPIPQEGAGMYCKTVKGTWSAENAAGAPGLGRYKHNPAYELKVPSQSQVIVRLQLVTVNPSISLNVTLFRLPESHKLGPHVATSGPYSHSAAGVAVGPQLLTAGSYVIIPSTFDADVLTSYKLIVYSSTTTILVNLITL